MTTESVSAALTLKVGAAGRVVLPVEFRAAEGIRPGDELVGFLKDGELHIMTRRRAWRRAQEMVVAAVPPDRLLVDELIGERRAEAAAE